MRSPVDFVNLQVDNITPDRYSTGVNVYSTVQVTFNSELNINTIFGNVLLLKDDKRNYIDQGKFDLSLYDRVDCNVEYKDKTVILKPINQFCNQSRYIVYIPKKSVEDFKGRTLLKDFISFFDTDGFLCNPDKPTNVLYPANNSIIKALDRIEFDDIGADRYIIQISTNKDFEIGLYEKIVSHTNITDDFGIFDGSYYIRVRSTNGDWGDISFFTIHSSDSSMICETDYETFEFEKVVDDTINISGVFPEVVNNVSVKTNLSYIKLDKIINFDEIDFYDSGLFEKHIKDEDFSLESVDGTFVGIHDQKNKCTYIVFIPDDL